MMHPGKVEDVLLIEDNPGDIRLTREIFKEALDCTIHVANEGDDALDFLCQQGKYTDIPRPNLILLDWYLPQMTGRDILTELKNDEDFKDIPVVVLSGPGAEIDLRREMQPRADRYLTKPIEPGECFDIANDSGLREETKPTI